MSKKQPAFDGYDVQPAPNDRVSVGVDEYARAVPGDQFQCAIVWAIRKKYPAAKRIRANAGEISFSIGDVRYHYPSDDEIVETVIRPLDTGGDLIPATVRLHDGYTTPVNYLDDDVLAAKRRQMAERASEARRNPGASESAKSGFRRFKKATSERTTADGGNLPAASLRGIRWDEVSREDVHALRPVPVDAGRCGQPEVRDVCHPPGRYGPHPYASHLTTAPDSGSAG